MTGLTRSRCWRSRHKVGSPNSSLLDVWYAHLNIDEVTTLMSAEVSEKRLGKKEGKEAERDITKARTRDSVRGFAKRTGEVGGELRIVRDPPLIVPIEDLLLSLSARQEIEKNVGRLIRSYRRTLSQEHHPIEEFRYVRMARKVVGVGSVGTRCWLMLMTGRDNAVLPAVRNGAGPCPRPLG